MFILIATQAINTLTIEEFSPKLAFTASYAADAAVGHLHPGEF
jgi:hypothetical protein